MIPTATHPLTPPFSTGHPISHSESSTIFPPSLDISSAPTLPPEHHPASPRFLLSLLATAVYLSIPSVASQALSAIVRTVGPHTVIRYLNFAIGHGIGPVHDPGTDNEGIDHESEAATGLDEVAELINDDEASSSYESIESIEVPADLLRKREEGASASAYRPGTRQRAASKHSRIGGEAPDSDTDSEHDAGVDRDAAEKGPEAREKTETRRPEPHYYYGALSDKVGEAAACWLSRWAIDMLRYEEQAEKDATSRDVIWSPAPYDAQCANERPGSAPPDMAGPRFGGKRKSSSGITVVAPVIWRWGGLSARWVRGLLSSDALFVRGEKERYEMGRSVVEMRRAAIRTGDSGLSEEEEAEFEKLFSGGVYYANMVRGCQ